jgi:two-component system, cell cycle sensor histidine kinase and response regulator CckA
MMLPVVQEASEFYDAQAAVLEQVAGGAPLPVVLAGTVRLVESQAAGMLCSILLYDEKRGTLHVGAAPSLPPALTCAVEGLPVGPGIGSCGTAAYTRQRVIVEDIATHPFWQQGCDIVLPLGLRACWSTPIFSAERALLGTFAMYYRESRGPSPTELSWVAAATHIAAIAIERERAEARLRQNEEQLRQAQKMEAVGRLAGGVAHDFNNILSVVLGTSGVILQDLEPEAPLRPEIEEIRRAGERAGELTRQLLAFSRAQMLAPRVVDLNEIVTGLEKMLRRLIGDDVALSFLAAPALAPVLADPGQLEQVIVNLVVNARDAMPEGGTLAIEIANRELDGSPHGGAAPGPYVTLTVTDSGHGMDAATRSRIFEPFFTTKERGKGTGLGLSSVYGIVTQSGGHVVVRSAPGAGTTFTLNFPRAQGDVEAGPAAPEPGRPVRLRGSETVLLVEDEDQVRATVRAILQRSGYTVLEAQNGGEAFLVCEQFPEKIDLLLTDVVMPRMNGPELAARLLALRPTLRVLYMSGHTEDATLHEGVASAAVAFLQKPVTPEMLLSKTRDVLDR